MTYPTLLEFAAPELTGYTPETTIAEKLEAMVKLDMANTRMKDFVDLWLLASARPFSGQTLAEAIRATFQRRGTSLPDSTPIALTPDFYDLNEKRRQWKGYLEKVRLKETAPSLSKAVELIRDLVMPIVKSITDGTAAPRQWTPGGPWK